MTKTPNFYINAFYHSKFRDNIFVIKAGGKVIEDEKALDNLTRDIRELTHHGIKVLLVYGGGRAMDEEAEKRGIIVQKTGGKRITDEAAMDIMKHVVGGDLSLAVGSSMAKNSTEGINFNAVPAEWMDVKRSPKTPEDTHTGAIQNVNARPINRLFKAVDFIACACMAYDEDGQLCNINADTIASHFAIGLQAHKLIFLSDVDGVKIKDETAFIITAEDVDGLIKDGTATGGMQAKLENCRDALNAGVRRIHLLNGLRENALRNEIFEPVGPGTMLIKESERQNYMNEVETQKLIEGAR